MIREVTPTQARLLDVALASGRREIDLDRDRPLLAEITPLYQRMLQDLANRGVVHRLKNGEYLIADVTAEGPEESAPWPVLLDIRMRPIAPYYVSYFSGLEQHGLTDHAATEITVAVLGRNVGSGRPLPIAGRRVLLARQSREDRWFGFRTIYQQGGSYQLGEKERVLLDVLDRPALSGGPETVTRAWARGIDDLDIDRLLDYASRLSQTVVRRAGVMLTLLGRESEADSLLPYIGTNRRAMGLFESEPDHGKRDSTWRVTYEVPRQTLLGWLAYER